LAIAKATLTLSGNLTYTGSRTISAVSLTGAGVNGESFTASGSADLASKNVQINQQLANVNGLTLTPNGGASLTNYLALTVENTSISVSQAPVTLTAPTINKVYDGGYTYDMTSIDLANMSRQLVGGDSVTAAVVVFTGNNPNAGSNKAVNLNNVTISDGNSGANYSVTLANSLTSRIAAAPLTVTASDSAKFVTRDDPINFNGVVYTGFVNGETASAALGGTLGVARTNASTNTAGSFNGVLVPSGLTANNGNYAVTYALGSFTIVPADQLLVQVTPLTAPYGSTATYQATAKYLGSNDVITTLTPVITGNSFNVSDGVGGSARFTITPVATTNSGSGNINVGGYQLSATNVTNTSNNFSNSIVLTGALTVSPLTLSADELGVSGVSKVYSGSNAISGLTLNTSSFGSRILSNDVVAVVATGTYVDANVGTHKSVTVAVGLAGRDAANYVLSSNQLTDSIGSITQLASVAYTGATGGNWSNASNWAGGAIPTLSNVANVIIPGSTAVVYDTANLVSLTPTSTINNSGTLSFKSSLATTFANTVSGTGSINQSGAGVLTLTGNNSYTGGTNINSSTLIAGSVNALGTGPITSNGGSFGVSPAIALPSLTVNGLVTLISDITTTSHQSYNDAVLINNPANSTTLASSGGNITFASTLNAGASDQTLTISALAGQVTFNGQVGVETETYNVNTQTYTPTTYAYFQANSVNNITNLVVSAEQINLNASISTLGTQTYNGTLMVGDNGSNGPTRVLLSEDPSIVFNGTIDDVIKGAHNLYVKAVTIVPDQIPVISFNDVVGGTAPLKSLTVDTGAQDSSAGALYGALLPSTYIGEVTITNNIATVGNQIYTAKRYQVGNGAAKQILELTSEEGNIVFNVAPANHGGGFTPASKDTTLSLTTGGGAVSGLTGSGLNYQIHRGLDADLSIKDSIAVDGVDSGSSEQGQGNASLKGTASSNVAGVTSALPTAPRLTSVPNQGIIEFEPEEDRKTSESAPEEPAAEGTVTVEPSIPFVPIEPTEADE
jgi:autotransporter-associated beta strand protein